MNEQKINNLIKDIEGSSWNLKNVCDDVRDSKAVVDLLDVFVFIEKNLKDRKAKAIVSALKGFEKIRKDYGSNRKQKHLVNMIVNEAVNIFNNYRKDANIHYTKSKEGKPLKVFEKKDIVNDFADRIIRDMKKSPDIKKGSNPYEKGWNEGTKENMRYVENIIRFQRDA